jgi:intracellular sulfur oxidation DsrE/DsrF family protein
MKQVTSRKRSPSWRGLQILCLMGLVSGGSAVAQDADHPVIAGHGAVQSADNLANPPDPSLRYRVVFDVTRAATDAAQVNPGLDRIARFVNLLGTAHIRPAEGDIVAVIRGPATPSVLNDAAYRTRFKQPNPNLGLIEALRRAGVAVHVCNYALGLTKIDRAEVMSDVVVDLAAMMTLATLQLKGWVAIAD